MDIFDEPNTTEYSIEELIRGRRYHTIDFMKKCAECVNEYMVTLLSAQSELAIENGQYQELGMLYSDVLSAIGNHAIVMCQSLSEAHSKAANKEEPDHTMAYNLNDILDKYQPFDVEDHNLNDILDKYQPFDVEDQTRIVIVDPSNVKAL